MGKLYFITGSSEQMRVKVYNVILQWSQAQQMQPLRPLSMPRWDSQSQSSQQQRQQVGQPTQQPGQQPHQQPHQQQNQPPQPPPQQPQLQPTQQPQAPEQAEPNFYLYNYLTHGNNDTLEQLTAHYGEDTVEAVYLRNREETEMMLLEKGIYKSYEPYTNLPQCLKEIVEMVFTGYQTVSYDFALALRQQELQQQQERYRQGQKLQNPYQQQTQQTQQAQQAQQAQQEAQQQGQRKKRTWKKPELNRWQTILLRIVALIAWVVIVCITTVGIYNAVNGNGIKKQQGSLIQVTMSPEMADTVTPFF